MATVLFYILAAIAVASTLLCITRRNPVHAVIFLVHTLFALALIFYLLGAPLVAVWEVIIYAGAIMVLFMFIIMMLELSPQGAGEGFGGRHWLSVLLLSATILGCSLALVALDPDHAATVPDFYASPAQFGYALFNRYPLAVEVVSFQLLFAAVGAFYVGRSTPTREGAP